MSLSTVGERKREITELLRRKGIANPQNNAEILLCAALGYSRAALLLRAPDSMPPEGEERLNPLLEQRLQRIPLEYIFREAFFYGRSFSVGPGCLIPRPETELLVEETLAYLPERGKIVDWGTGSGCIAATLALEHPGITCLGVEASPQALRWAWRNLQKHDLLQRVFLWHGRDPESIPWKENLDLVVSNPPYIPRGMLSSLMREVQQEPSLALDGGESGLEAYELLFPWVTRALSPGGVLAVEIGDPSQVSPLLSLGNRDLVPLKVRKDYNGLDRVILWRKSP
jgi:release factor glutamine methyltransferase